MNEAAQDLPTQASITDRNDLDEFLATATLADSEFTAERLGKIDLASVVGVTQVLSKRELEQVMHRNKHIVRVPRRPNWRLYSSADDFKRAENIAFLDWRKQLASIENDDTFVLTPFERNLEMWRQLWRVVETVDLLVQIVDARNPLLFYCEDLVEYAMETKPKMKFLLLVNKADLLSPEQKDSWAQYFESRGIFFKYFSALEDSSEFVSNRLRHESDIDRSELLDHFEATLPRGGHVGFVGYPNVGKSSTINAIIGEKRVSVAATPGKTKHFQTINLANNIVLCDCPGLVFPNISSSRSELVLNGILPIDQLRDYIGPSRLLCDYIPKSVFEAIYGLSFTLKHEAFEEENVPSEYVVDYSQLLSTYAIHRGYRTSNFGNPDESRASRILLKDFVGGKLLYCYPPPTWPNAAEFNLPNQLKAIEDNKNRPKPKPQDIKLSDPFLDTEKPVAVFSKKPNGLSGYSGFTLDQNQVKSSSKKHYKMSRKK